MFIETPQKGSIQNVWYGQWNQSVDKHSLHILETNMLKGHSQFWS